MSEIHPDLAAAVETARAAGLAAVDVAAVADLPAPATDDWAARVSDYQLRWFHAGELYGPPDAHGRRYSVAGWFIQCWDGGEIAPHVRSAFQQLVRAASGRRAPGATGPSAVAGTEDQQFDAAAPGGDMPMLIELDLDGRP
ncbi:hypothetical protein ACFFRE_00195 [Aciditerrimonas ferrireducens]|jgi:hypothetical protein|uniref:Uncharacterized protein n=1 Tax=Aciditerrimonas ferrireducens TaxID=667306 RepID=A0ABV6BZT8_9ACTN